MKIKYLAAITGCALSLAIFSSNTANAAPYAAKADAVFIVKNENPVGSLLEDRVGIIVPLDGNAFMPYGGPNVG